MKKNFASQTFATQNSSDTPPVFDDSPKNMKVLKSKTRSSIRMSRNTEVLLVTDTTEGTEQ